MLLGCMGYNPMFGLPQVKCHILDLAPCSCCSWGLFCYTGFTGKGCNWIYWFNWGNSSVLELYWLQLCVSVCWPS